MVFKMMKKKGEPRVGEFVICKIKSISPNSATAELQEYEIEGMIHISEIKSGWIKDIRKHIKIDQVVVAKVVKISGSYIYLSIKRVDENQKRNKLKEHNLSLKAEKMFELCAKELNITKEKAYSEVGNLLLEKYGSFYDVFKVSMKTPAKIEALIPKKWAEKIREIAEKNIEQKEFEFRAKVFIKSLEPDGVLIIKDVLKKAAKSGLEVKYISAPEYMVRFNTKDAKKGEKEFTEKLEKLKKEKNVSFDYKIVE
jgi:translation initiation factor 2 subunit 1